MDSRPSHVSSPRTQPHLGSRHGDATTKQFFDHSSAQRVNTDTVIAKALKEQYPSLQLAIAPQQTSNLLAYASAGNASFKVLDESTGSLPSSIEWKIYAPPARRIDGSVGVLLKSMVFGKFLYKWKDEEFIVYLVDGRDGTQAYPEVTNFYILTSEMHKAEALITAAGIWSNELHKEIWVFDQGYWQKSAELYHSIENASWESVILDPEMKKSIINDHLSFFDSRDTYRKLSVVWRRGVILHGAPGNGKTISIKAMMNMLYKRADPIPTLYVRSLTSYAGPEYSIKMIFEKARQLAPCYLVLEDLDTIVSDFVRSYFLNEVDGLKNNDGIFMVGSTNHLDRLDPGISKRPSRFDRKYLFSDPNNEERIAYCKFWQGKLKSNQDIDFPDKLCEAIAGITDKFSFAYMQEAFVAALLAIARDSKEDKRAQEALTVDMVDGWVGVLTLDDEEDDLKKLILWVEIKKQIAILREGMENEKGELAI